MSAQILHIMNLLKGPADTPEPPPTGSSTEYAARGHLLHFRSRTQVEFAALGGLLHFRSMGLSSDMEFAPDDRELEFAAKGQ